MTPGTYTLSEVARRLGLEPARFSELRDQLEAERGFPAPLFETSFIRDTRKRGPVLVRRGLWSRRQVDDWVDGKLKAAIAGVPAPAAGPDPELAQRAERLAGRARGRGAIAAGAR